MAKKIFQLAKELGLKSKDVVDRCVAEGIPNIENHMSPVSAGLEATIRSWYADGGVALAAGEGESVATASLGAVGTVTAVKAPAKAARATARKKPIEAAATAPAAPAEAPTSAAALRAATAKVAKVRAGDGTPVAEPISAGRIRGGTRSIGDTITVDTDVAAPALEEEGAPAGPGAGDVDLKAPPSRGRGGDADVDAERRGVEAEGPSISHARGLATAPDVRAHGAPPNRGAVPAAREPGRPVGVPFTPQRPSAVRPAGPMLSDVQQKPARVSGPTVVRIEAAEVVDKPRAARGDGATGGRGATGLPGGDSDVSRRNTRRKTRTGREGRSASAGEGDRAGRGRSWGEQDLLEREERLRGAHGFIKTVRRDAARPDHVGERAKTAKQTGGVVRIQEPFSLKDLSAATGVTVAEIVKVLFKKGIMSANPNASIPTDLAMELMMDYGIELVVEEAKSAEAIVAEKFAQREVVDLQPRSPVVTILGHVDHGKTSLLDRIRQANVAAGEAGGITQHTSAFRVKVRAGDEDKTIVFLDTPGHQAFTAMRARGASITDIAVLVVAADDGVMPQTVESINHAKAANVPIVVALNKIDKPEATDANIQRILGQLAGHELSPVEWGGKTEVVRVSAVKGVGIESLLDTIDLQAQLMELQADAGGPARGTVIEARMVEGRGPVANVLIQEGRVKVGDFIVIGRAYGRVRDMTDDRGQRLREAGPSTPLEISGLSAVPDAGDRAYVVESLRIAEDAAQQRVAHEREKALAAPRVTLDNIFAQMKGAARKEFNLVVKGDVQGSVETLKRALEDISTDEVNIRVLHTAVGGITEADVSLAEASGAIVLGFHVIASARARELAEQRHVEIRTYQIIYELLDEVRQAASGLLAPEQREEILGHATVREVFKITKVGMVAGCYVTDGVIERNARIRVTRGDIVIENNRVLEQLRRFKDDVKEVRSGQECGMKIEGYDDIKPGDVLECYKTVTVARQI